METHYFVLPLSYKIIHKSSGITSIDDPPYCLSENYDNIENETDLVDYLRSELGLTNESCELKINETKYGNYDFTWETEEYIKSIKLCVYKSSTFA